MAHLWGFPLKRYYKPIRKLMESIVRDEIVDYMNRNTLFTNDQHGFVPMRTAYDKHGNLDQNGRRWRVN